MDILSVLKENIAGVLDSLYGLSDARIDLQATREEFAGDVTLLVFPYAKRPPGRSAKRWCSGSPTW